MFGATKPFNNSITNYPKEPSLRIGRCVPKNAVNLAYYYNPTATDTEKVLTSAAPRNTIDHRVEEGYKYLFNQASDDDDLFPGSIFYEDEEGYTGRLGRMYTNWHSEAHIETKNVQLKKDVIVVNKSEVPKVHEYSEDEYSGNLYLDAAEFEVTKTKDETVTELLDRQVFAHEVNYYDIFNDYVNPNNIDKWMKVPNTEGNSEWPQAIVINEAKCVAPTGNEKIKEFVNATNNPYDEATGVLTFDKLEYEQVWTGSYNEGKVANGKIGPSLIKEITCKNILSENIEAKIVEENNKIAQTFKSKYEASYNKTTDKYEYNNIAENTSNPSANTFINIAVAHNSKFKESGTYKKLISLMDGEHDIVIYLDKITSKITKTEINKETGKATFTIEFTAKYKYKCSNKGSIKGGYHYNIIAVYKGTLKKAINRIKEVPAEYNATCHYTGIVRKVWYDYDGIAYYRGAVTKGNGVGNINPEGDNEILMYSDDNGYLRRPVEVTDENGNVSIKNFYRVESDYVYLTDVFKDNIACFYKYPLKLPIYDYRGPDDNGFYEGNAVKVFTSGLKDIPKNYKYNMKLAPSEYEIVSDITDDFHITSKKVPKKYSANLYTSFISSSSDTFKVIYNAFNDSEEDNIALDNGVEEEIYNYPAMIPGVDFSLEEVDHRARINKIKLTQPIRIADTRRYVTFSYTITAENKKENKKITTSPKTVSILNKDFVVPSEYKKFDERAMIISPMVDGILQSPFDMILHYQATSNSETIIDYNDKDFIFYTTITEIKDSNRGAVNIKCNPDGSGYITAETTVDTGFWDEITGTYTKKLCLDSPYHIENGYIYPGIKVKCIDTRHIRVQSPREDRLLDSWYPRIQFGHYSQILDQYGSHVKVCYSMPEYDEQHYSEKHGKPYVDIKEEQVTILNSHMVKTSCFPLLIKENKTTINLYKKLDNELFEIHIKDISYSDGIIITEETISENDNIICNYTYIEESYVYRGFWRNKDDFARIDLNPNQYHTYSDLTYTPSVTKPSKNLFNKVIYFFMRPSVKYEIDSSNDSLIYNIEDEEIGRVVLENKDTLYHQINNAQPAEEHDIYIGSVYIRQNTSLHSTILVDSRTRGGGVIESMKDSLRRELEPESDYYLDIGYYDGEPYQENGVIIIRLDNSLLKEFGGRFTQDDIELKVKRWLGFGVYPIIEYVDSYSKRDMPQYNLVVEDSYTNVTNETPEIILECVENI
jgi:hypothetical protein